MLQRETDRYLTQAVLATVESWTPWTSHDEVEALIALVKEVFPWGACNS